MKKIYFKAVIIGTITDLLATFLLGIIFVHDNTALPFVLALGLECTVVGGYVAASIAPNDKMFNATMIGVIGILIGLPFLGSNPIWFSILSIILMPPAAYLGGIFKLKI